MISIWSCALPHDALLRRYADGSGYTDCYAVDLSGPVSQAAFVEAFYTTWLFKIERALLARFAGRPSTDLDARQLAAGAAVTFAAWRVEEQNAQQLLMADFTGKTRSWLMAVPLSGADASGRTRLYFGSAVVAHIDTVSGRATMGVGFRALLGFHKMYSRLLLRAAAARVLRSR
jgi:hypothetical protein